MQRRSAVDGNRWRWSSIRRVVLARDGHRCQGNGPRCTKVATEVDHIDPRLIGGDDSFDNLRSLCHTCHNTRGVWESRAPSRYSYGRSRVVTRDYSRGTG
jgi:5-methylcytosine-specific restriction endonuclease McrA